MNTKTIQYDPALWQLVPIVATQEMCAAAHFGPNCAEHAVRSSDREFWQECHRAMLAAAPSAPEQPADPMDWPLPCDVTVGNGTIGKGCPLRVLVKRMEILHGMAMKAAKADLDPKESLLKRLEGVSEPKQEGLTDEQERKLFLKTWAWSEHCEVPWPSHFAHAFTGWLSARALLASQPVPSLRHSETYVADLEDSLKQIADLLGVTGGADALLAKVKSMTAAPVAAVPDSVRLEAFQAHHDKKWHIIIKHPFGTSWVRMSNDRDALLAQLIASAPTAAAQAAPVEAVGQMVNRFLGWPLPKTFRPDCGIAFDGRKDDEFNKNKTWPVGTNLLTADEAKAMFEHVLAGPAPLTKERRDAIHAKVLATIPDGPDVIGQPVDLDRERLHRKWIDAANQTPAQAVPSESVDTPDQQAFSEWFGPFPENPTTDFLADAYLAQQAFHAGITYKAAQGQDGAVAWRVGEFVSSSNPSNIVLCLALEHQIAAYEKRVDFIRWTSSTEQSAWLVNAKRYQFMRSRLDDETDHKLMEHKKGNDYGFKQGAALDAAIDAAIAAQQGKP